MIDFLRPIGNDNREEVLLVQYEGYIKNMTEELILKMAYSRSYWEEQFPTIKEYFSMSHLELYDATVFFSPYQMLSIVSDFKAEPSLLHHILTELYPNYSVEDIRVSTAYSFAIKQLIQKKFVKKLIIATKSHLTVEDKLYVRDEIMSRREEICEFIQYDMDSDMEDMVLTYKPTTVFIDSFELLESIHKKLDETQRKKILYIVRENTDTCHWDESLNAYVPNHTTEEYLKRGINMAITSVPSTGIDKTLSDAEPLG